MKVFANVFARAFFVLGMLATPAWAIGDAPTAAVKETAPAAEKKADPKCEGITLTGEKFLDMIYAIAMHGDLTDVPFIEKTLETKFEVKHSEYDGADGYVYRHTDYVGKDLFGADLNVSLKFIEYSQKPRTEPKRKINLSKSAMLHFEAYGQVWPCFNVTVNQFAEKFGGSFGDDFMPADGMIITSGKYLEGVSKDGSELKVYYNRNRNSTIIVAPLIDQKWK